MQKDLVINLLKKCLTKVPIKDRDEYTTLGNIGITIIARAKKYSRAYVFGGPVYGTVVYFSRENNIVVTLGPVFKKGVKRYIIPLNDIEEIRLQFFSEDRLKNFFNVFQIGRDGDVE